MKVHAPASIVWIYADATIAILGWPLALAAISDDVRWLGVYVGYALAGIVIEFRRMR